MSAIPDEQTYPDIIDMCLDGQTTIKTIARILAELDREVTGYEYEVYDENGDNPEECFSEPSIDGYFFEYEGMRWVTLRVYLKRDHPEKLEQQWRQWFYRWRQDNLKIMSLYAQRVCLEGTGKWSPEWDGLVRGKVPRLSWGFDGLRGLYGIDLDNPTDNKLLHEWINYVFKNYRNPPKTEYYHYTGSLGHN